MPPSLPLARTKTQTRPKRWKFRVSFFVLAENLTLQENWTEKRNLARWRRSVTQFASETGTDRRTMRERAKKERFLGWDLQCLVLFFSLLSSLFFFIVILFSPLFYVSFFSLAFGGTGKWKENTQYDFISLPISAVYVTAYWRCWRSWWCHVMWG